MRVCGPGLAVEAGGGETRTRSLKGLGSDSSPTPQPPLPPKFFPTHPNSLETLDYTTRTTPRTPAPKPTVQGQRLSEVARQTSFGAAELFGGDPGPKPEPPQTKDDKASVDLLSELEKEV